MRFDHRNLLRRMVYVSLTRRRDESSPWVRTSQSFPASFAGHCADCGMPIVRKSTVRQGRFDQHFGVVHDVCPSWEVRYETLFQADGDLELGVLEAPSDQRCFICQHDLVAGSVLVANPNPYVVMDPTSGKWISSWRSAAYVCAGHVERSGKARSLEERRAEALGLEPPVTQRGYK